MKTRVLTAAMAALVALPAQAAFNHQRAGDVMMFAPAAMGASMAFAYKDTEGAKQLAYTMGATFLSTQVLKHGFRFTSLNARPDGGDFSFPSGHTSTACAGAAFVGERYGWRFGAVAMVPATYVAWSRVHAQRHHVRDVVIGCAVGLVSGVLLSDPMKKTQLQPWYENKTVGLRLQSHW